MIAARVSSMIPIHQVRFTWCSPKFTVGAHFNLHVRISHDLCSFSYFSVYDILSFCSIAWNIKSYNTLSCYLYTTEKKFSLHIQDMDADEVVQ